MQIFIGQLGVVLNRQLGRTFNRATQSQVQIDRALRLHRIGASRKKQSVKNKYWV